LRRPRSINKAVESNPRALAPEAGSISGAAILPLGFGWPAYGLLSSVVIDVKKLLREKLPPKNEFPPFVVPPELFPPELFAFESAPDELFLFPLGGPAGRPFTVLWNGRVCLLNQFEDASAALAKP
jgi:hypothetical protein